MKTRNSEALDSFTSYCMHHPHERFWQALRNWSRFDSIIGENGMKHDVTESVDTFNIEGLAGTRVPAQPCGTCKGTGTETRHIGLSDYKRPCPDCSASSQEGK